MDLERRLESRFRADASEILFGVRNDAGFNASRTADAIAIGLWPSTGCTLEGFEIKVSRSDWLRELKDGSKSAAFLEHMDFWWLVAPREIVNDEELPPTWGLMVPRGTSLTVVRQAKRNATPAPMPRGMLAALVKRASTKKVRDAAIQAAEQCGYERGKKSVGSDYDKRRLDELQKAVTAFYTATGIHIEHVYEPDRLKQAYAMVKNGGHLDIARKLGHSARNVEELAERLREIERDIASNIERPSVEAVA
ncbi:MAG TPA: hypothetical protein VII66_00865 [Gemmatimonadaceae bacterium]